MIKDKESSSFLMILVTTIIIHLVILYFVKKNELNYHLIQNYSPQKSTTFKLDHLKLLKKNEFEIIKKVGIKDGLKTKNFIPDQIKLPPPANIASPNTSYPQGLSLKNLAPPFKMEEGQDPKNKKENLKILRHDNIKQEIYNASPVNPQSAISKRMSNFDIKIQRPEGVSEDELNSDEKAFYSFFKRSYLNYLTKIYSTFEKINIERPQLEKDLFDKHFLIGQVDYDQQGNIILIKILKSSTSDHVHFFFEEVLKQLNLPNPPKSFTKSKKQFTTFYQIQIN